MPDTADMTDLLEWILGRDPSFVAGDGFPAWWRATRDERRRWTVPLDQAVAGGLLADRVAYAFAAGYQAALRRLVPALAAGDRVASLSVTEEGGGHPRAIQLVLEAISPGAGDAGPWRLSGRKRWATLAPQADSIFVAASAGTDSQGRNRIRLARVDAGAPGLTIRAMPQTSFAPEIEHAEIELDGVEVPASNLLPGDGYDEYIKPFRTIEDVHVAGALLGYLLRVAAASDWSHETREKLLGLVAQLRSIALADPARAAVHLALAGFFSFQRRMLEEIEPLWESTDPETRERWQRDKGLMGVAGAARSKRREVAWGRAGERSG